MIDPGHPVDDALAARIPESVAAGFEDEVAFVQELVRLPSLRGAERAAQDAMARALEARGYRVDTLALDIEAIREHPGFSPVTVDYADAVSIIGTRAPSRRCRA